MDAAGDEGLNSELRLDGKQADDRGGQPAPDAGLRLPPTLQTRFESDFAAATIEADAESAAIDAFVAAEASRLANPNPLETIGLLGTDPEASLAEGRDAFAAGDLVAAVDAAGDAHATWVGAGEVGRNRILTALGLVLLVVLAAGLLVGWYRRRRTRRRATSLGEADPARP